MNTVLRPPSYSQCTSLSTSRDLISSAELQRPSVARERNEPVSNPVSEEVQTNARLHGETSNQADEAEIQDSRPNSNRERNIPMLRKDSWIQNEGPEQSNVERNKERSKKKKSKSRKLKETDLTDLPPLRGRGARDPLSENRQGSLLPPIQEAPRAKSYDIFTVYK